MFQNIPPTDFTLSESIEAYKKALADLDQKIISGALTGYPIINGEEINTGRVVKREDPSNSSVTLGSVHFASLKEAESAINLLKKSSTHWELTNFEVRAAIISKAGDIMTKRRYELAAMLIREAGKTWKEAEAEVAEAIDFCQYYADEMVKLGPPKTMGSMPGEINQYFYQPRGIAVVISPWNFPLAIACGMTVAALVTGNATILKPSEQTGLVAFTLSKILLEAGVPNDVFAYLPGVGEEIGAHLVDHSDIDLICFTGSKPVGIEILKRAAVVKPGQRNIKKVIAELGGKNAIIIDEDADLDEALKGVLQSAFGYAGQKCSACSRLIVIGNSYEQFVQRLSDAAKDIIIGPASDPATFIGPVIDKESMDRIKSTIDKNRNETLVAFERSVPTTGYFVSPTIFRDVKQSSSLWKEEIFGPVVACCRARDLDHAIELANDCQYALTGGVFSRSPNNIDRLITEFKVGNLYINRGCTGAVVYRQPFGGFKMSGIGSKAGGPDYLIQFMEPRTVTENTMRRGFAPSTS